MSSNLSIPIANRDLRELNGRLKFIGVPIQERIDQIKVPVPTIQDERHELNEVGKVCGMLGVEVEALHKAAMADIPYNDMLAKAYRDFLMIVKIYHSEGAAKAKKSHDIRVMDRAKRDKEFIIQKNQYESKIAALKFKWNEVEVGFRSRWVRLITTLTSLIEKNPSYKALPTYESILIDIFHDMNLVKLDHDLIYGLQPRKIKKLSNDEIQYVLNQFETKLDTKEYQAYTI